MLSTGFGSQIADIAVALVLSTAIGMEREVRQKHAGLRTHTLVGVGAALFMLVSKFGFSDVVTSGLVVLDPSRVAAQVVSGIGFLGGGVIFVSRGTVRGLTSAAGIWLTAAVGLACGAGLLGLATVVTIAYFVVVFLYPVLMRALPNRRIDVAQMRVTYVDGRGVLRRTLRECSDRGFGIERLGIEREAGVDGSLPEGSWSGRSRSDGPGSDGPAADGSAELLSPGGGVVTVTFGVAGRTAVHELAAAVTELDGVVSVQAAQELDGEV